MTTSGKRMLTLLASLTIWSGAVAGNAPQADPPYVVRGHQTDAKQQQLTDRFERIHQAFLRELESKAPGLLKDLEPPSRPRPGYQQLPQIVPDANRGPATLPEVVSYSWSRSDSGIERELAALDRLDADLRIASSRDDRAALAACVASYQAARGRRQSIDSNVSYNWFWQADIVRARAFYDRRTALLDQAVSFRNDPTRLASIADAILAAAGGLKVPEFVTITNSSPSLRVVKVPFYTDISDSGFLNRFKQAVEDAWHVSDGTHEYRVDISFEVLSVDGLYCGNPPLPGASCSPPARGESIDLSKHLARFPKGRAILTTGASALQVTAEHAITLTPFDVASRPLAHEFGHLIGIPDLYLRGYRDRGTEGFEVLELVPDLADIMSSPGFGKVLSRHFQWVLEATQKR